MYIQWRTKAYYFHLPIILTYLIGQTGLSQKKSIIANSFFATAGRVPADLNDSRCLVILDANQMVGRALGFFVQSLQVL